MICPKFLKMFILGTCIAVFSTSMVFASTGDVQQAAEGDSISIAVSDNAQSVDVKLVEKQSEIDKYVFEDHKDEIAKKGFTVTHTGPMDNYVEIGITPYSDENAEFLYKAFGREKVKVVEGQQASIMELGTGNSNNAEIYTANSSPVEEKKVSGIGTAELIAFGSLAAVILIGTVVLINRRKISAR